VTSFPKMCLEYRQNACFALVTNGRMNELVCEALYNL